MLGHLTTAVAWEQAQLLGQYRVDSLQRQGFIHLSQADQVLLAAGSHYRGRTDLILLIIDPDRLDADALVFEAGSPPNQHLIFPHLYGPLPLDAVLDVQPFPCQPDGSFRGPVTFQRRADTG